MHEDDDEHRVRRSLAVFRAALGRIRPGGGDQSRVRPNIDVVSVLTLTAALMLSTVFGLLEVSWFHTDALAARVRDLNEDAAYDPTAASAAPTRLHDCVVDVGAVARTQPCDMQARQAWLFGASNKLRKAMGEAPCWWHANAFELAEIRGIQISYAMLAVKTRDHVDGYRLPLELDEELGARRAKLLKEGSSTSCALDAR